MDYENIIEDIGGFGRWQVVIFVSICVPDFLFVFTVMLPVFVGSDPNWYCSDDVASNQSQISMYTTNYTEGITNLTKCECTTHQFNDSFTSIVGEWDLVCQKDYVSDLISSIQLGGLAVGSVVFAQMSDAYGRKKMLFLSILIMGLTVFISSFSISWQMFAVLKFVVGVSVGGYFCMSCVYPLEFVSRKWRTLCGTLGFWPIGQLILALLAYLIRDWRYLTAATSTVAFLCMFLWWVIPESPRWLLQRGRIEEAKAIFTMIAVRNNKPVPDMSFLDALCTTSGKKEVKKKYTFFHLFKKRIVGTRTVACSLIWFVILLVYYELAYKIKHLSGNMYLNVVYGGLFDLTGLISVLIFNNTLGRRLCLMLILGLLASVNAALLAIYAMGNDINLDTAVTWLALFGKGFANAATYFIQIFSAELFPTDIRSLGVGTAACVGRVGALLAPQLLYLGTYFKIIPYAVMMSACGLAFPLLFLLPETNGKGLVDDFNLIQKNQRQEEEKVNLKDLKM